MKHTQALIATAIGSLMTLAVVTASGTAVAAEKMEIEKCYGVSKAGKNDCQTSTHACAGTATMDNQKDSFVVVPKGTCDKIAGSSLTMGKAAK
jgi:uncharacterized membrane protein